MIQTVDIYVGSCHLQLSLPAFFEQSTLTSCRKVFKLLTREPYRNEEAHEKLTWFFTDWYAELSALAKRGYRKRELEKAGKLILEYEKTVKPIFN